MREFVRQHKYERCHETIWNVTPADVYYARRDAILGRREEAKGEKLG